MKPTDFCPTCRYYLYLDQDNKTLRRICRNCGYQEEDKKGGLILEIDLKEKTSEGYKILMNEFTKQDPTLPHVNTIKCPSDGCKSNTSGFYCCPIFSIVSTNYKYIRRVFRLECTINRIQNFCLYNNRGCGFSL